MCAKAEIQGLLNACACAAQSAGLSPCRSWEYGRNGHERSPAMWSLSIGDSHQRLVISPPQVLGQCPWLVLGREQENEDNLGPSLRFTDG